MDEIKRTDLEFVNKMYRYMKNDMPIMTGIQVYVFLLFLNCHNYLFVVNVIGPC